MNIKLKDAKNIKVSTSLDIYEVMQRILMRENRIDRNREHFWTISLDSAFKILNIELVSFGTVTQTIAEPMEVFSIPLQKRSVSLVLVHNHPGGSLLPSKADKELTDRLIQVGRLLNVPVQDHLIITEKSYYSFKDSGELAKLEQSEQYVTPYELKKQYEKLGKQTGEIEGEKRKARELARTMKKKGYSTEEIVEITGLNKGIIQRLKTE